MRYFESRAIRLVPIRALFRSAGGSALILSVIASMASAQDGGPSRSSPRYIPTGVAIGDRDRESAFPLFAPELTRERIRSPDLRLTPQQDEEVLKWYQTATFKRTIAPATLITLGLLGYGDGGLIDRQAVREWRNTFIPDFEDHTDDHTQFVSGLLALGLNAAGVPGKHNLLRASGTYALSLSIMFVAVHTGKELMAVKRPDNTSNNAFPSGHTAASFASARFLDREYGHVSYLYSLTGYSLAAYTGVMRQLNNRHWLSDVLVGAGVGLLSTDLAYILMDEFFGDRGKLAPRPPGPGAERGHPSFLDFRLAYAKQVGDLDKRDELFFAEDGWSAGFEGAYFFNDYFGVGGDLGVAGFPVNDDNFVPQDDMIIAVGDEIVTQPFGAEWLYAGPFFNLPLNERWAVSGKLTAGVNQGATARIFVQVKDEFQDQIGAKEAPIVEYDPTLTFGAAANLAVRFMVSNRIGIRVFGEYNYSAPDYRIREITGFEEDGTVVTGPVLSVENVDFSFVSLGATVSALLW